MRKILLSLAVLAGLVTQASAADNYNATAGSGLTFGAKDAAGVLYSRFIGCDNTTVSQCWTVDSSGRLSTLSTVNTWAGGTLGAMANYGTSPGAVLVPGVNAYITGSAVGTVAGTTSTSALASLVNCASTTSPSGQTTGNQSYVNCTVNGQVRVTPSFGTSDAVGNACETVAQSYANGVITSATTTRVITPSASNKTYICSMLLTASAADNVGVVEGTGGTCGTGTAGVIGGTTAANGLNFTANGGLMMQAGGKVSVAQTAGTNVDFCLITSTSGPLTYSIKYVQAP